MKWKYIKSRKTWKCITHRFEVRKGKGVYKYELLFDGEMLSDISRFKKLSTAKEVAELIING